MYHNEYHYWGMHYIWWVLWISLLFWIFVIPYDIPGQRTQKSTPLDILKRRFASGQIDKKEYEEKKRILEGK